MDFLLARCALGHHFQVFGFDHGDVAALHQQTAVDALEVPTGAALGGPLATFKQAHVGFGSDDGARFSTDFRRDDHFDELTVDDRLGGGGVQLAVEGDDAAEGRFGVGGVGQFVGLANAAFAVQGHGHAARVGVLDDHAGRLDEALHALKGSIGVSHVVERQLFALQLYCSGNAGFAFLCFHVERRALVRVLAVAHFLSLDELAVEGLREGAAGFGGQGCGRLVDGAQVVGDHAVVGGGVLEGLEHQGEALGVGQAAGLQAGQHVAVVTGVDHDGHVFVVLGGGADHGRAADVDVLDGVRQGAARLGHGGGERVEVDRHQVDRLDAVLGHDAVVDAAAAKDAAVDFRVQGLHPAVHHFCEAGVVGHFDRGYAVVLQQLEGAAGGEDFHAEVYQFAGELKDAGLVGDADQGAADREASGLVGHGGFHQAVKGFISKKADASRAGLFHHILGLQQVVLFELLAQGAAIQAEQLGGLGLVALDVIHHGFQQRCLDFGQHQVVDVGDVGTFQAGEVVVQCPLHIAAQGLAFGAGGVEVLLQINVVTHRCCPIKGCYLKAIQLRKMLGHGCHAATPCFSLCRSMKNCRTLAHCASVDSNRLNWARNSLAPGRVARYQPTCLRAMRTPITSP